MFELAHLVLILKKRGHRANCHPQTRHLRLCAFVLSHAWLVGRVIGSAGTLPPSRSLTAEGAEKRLAACVAGHKVTLGFLSMFAGSAPSQLLSLCPFLVFLLLFFLFGAGHDNRARSLLHLLPRAPSPHYLVLHDSCFSFDCFVNPSFCATPPTATAAARILFFVRP